MKRALLAAAAAIVVAGCGNFFPNPDNVVVPSGVRDYALVCAPAMRRVDCEARAAGLVEVKRTLQPTLRVVKVEVDPNGYKITFDDGNWEFMTD